MPYQMHYYYIDTFSGGWNETAFRHNNLLSPVCLEQNITQLLTSSTVGLI